MGLLKTSDILREEKTLRIPERWNYDSEIMEPFFAKGKIRRNLFLSYLSIDKMFSKKRMLKFL